MKLPILHFPNITGRFHLYDRQTRNYSLTELEMCILAINIASFSRF